MILECIVFSLSTIDWTAIGAIITMFMMIATFLTVLQNRNQVIEIKKQWEEENRPRLFFSIEVFNKYYALRISNVGNFPAHNIDISLSESFISKLPAPYSWIFERINKRPFALSPQSTKYFTMGTTSQINNIWKDIPYILEIKGKYNEKYSIDVVLPLQEYIGKVECLPYAPIEQSLEYLSMDIYSEDGKEKQESLITIMKSIRDILANEKQNGTEQDK